MTVLGDRRSKEMLTPRGGLRTEPTPQPLRASADPRLDFSTSGTTAARVSSTEVKGHGSGGVGGGGASF